MRNCGGGLLAEHVRQHGQASLEAAMSQAEARAYATAQRVGARKFRVEGSRAGNSRFVYKPTAERLQVKYGGQVVNYRPRQRRLRRAR